MDKGKSDLSVCRKYFLTCRWTKVNQHRVISHERKANDVESFLMWLLFWLLIKLNRSFALRMLSYTTYTIIYYIYYHFLHLLSYTTYYFIYYMYYLRFALYILHILHILSYTIEGLLDVIPWAKSCPSVQHKCYCFRLTYNIIYYFIVCNRLNIIVFGID